MSRHVYVVLSSECLRVLFFLKIYIYITGDLKDCCSYVNRSYCENSVFTVNVICFFLTLRYFHTLQHWLQSSSEWIAPQPFFNRRHNHHSSPESWWESLLFPELLLLTEHHVAAGRVFDGLVFKLWPTEFREREITNVLLCDEKTQYKPIISSILIEHERYGECKSAKGLTFFPSISPNKPFSVF